MSDCVRCRAREEVLEQVVGDRRMIEPSLWQTLHGHTEKVEGVISPARAPAKGNEEPSPSSPEPEPQV